MVSEPMRPSAGNGSLPTFFFTIMPGAIFSTPMHNTVSWMPALMAIQPSRNAVAPVAQALVQLTTGMPVWPISCNVRCPVMGSPILPL